MWLYPYTMIITQIYFFIFGVLCFKYAFKSRKYPEKMVHPEYFINEMIVACSFFILAIFYPWLFHYHIENELVRHQCYFHVWNSSTVQYICWSIYIQISVKNNKKNGVMTDYKQWKEHLLDEYNKKNKIKADFKRKLMHIIPPILIISMYYMGNALDGITMAGVAWDYGSLAVFWSISFGFAFLFVMITADLFRLNNFEKLGKFAHNWLENSIIPKELNTFTSANVMILALIPFFFTPFRIIFAIVVIGAVSDAAASLVGNKFGKKRNPNDPKTREGYIAGALTTYLVVIGLNLLLNQTEPSIPMLKLHLLGIFAALGFFLVDKYIRKVSDNFLNPTVTGIMMLFIYYII